MLANNSAYKHIFLAPLFSKYSSVHKDYSVLLFICQHFALNFRNITPKAMEASSNFLMGESFIILFVI